MSIDMIPMPPSVSIEVHPMSIPISVDTDVVSIDMDVMSVATDPVSIDTDPMSKGMWIGMPFMSVRHDPSLDSVPIGHDSHTQRYEETPGDSVGHKWTPGDTEEYQETRGNIRGTPGYGMGYCWTPTTARIVRDSA